MLKVDVPEGNSGEWSVSRFSVSKRDARWGVFSYKHRAPPPGEYTRLMRGRTVIMSDTRAEVSDHYFLKGQTGVGLLNGLGLGVGIELCMETADFVFVVENSKDVLNLSAGHYLEKYGDRLEIIYADALRYKPPKGMHFNFVWHDIWDDICGDNLGEMSLLKRRYGRLCGGNQACWAEYEARRGC